MVSRHGVKVDSQLIVVDFTRVKRRVDFEGLTGFTTDTISYYRDELFDNFAAYLFNYDRWQKRPLFELAFLFTEPVEPTWQGEVKLPSTQAIYDIIGDVVKRYRTWSKSELVAVANNHMSSVCGFVSTEKYPSPGMTLSWLVEPFEEKHDAQPSTGEDSDEAKATS